ncbi:MAG: Na+/H+ antiporter subunit C [Pseudomonadota bacterium]
MEILLGSLAGVLMAASVWLMLSRNLVKFLLGLVLIGNVANLVIFVSGGLTYGAPPLIAEGATVPGEIAANALPQALILTAIVIGFGLVAFTLVLALRAYQELGTVNVDAMNLAEAPAPSADKKAEIVDLERAA